MSRHWSPLAITYVALAIAGLVGTWFPLFLAMRQRRMTQLAASVTPVPVPPRA